MKFFRFLITVVLVGMLSPIQAQLPPVFDAKELSSVRTTSLTRKYLTADRIVWTSDPSGKFIQNAENILIAGIGQADMNQGKYLTLISDKESKPGLVLDFGKEIQGGIEIVTTIHNSNPAGKLRIRLGRIGKRNDERCGQKWSHQRPCHA